ncbi:MAG: alkylmercury lyase family protein [Paracoccaceae bacterium]|nr:alkylmercury lyase family protein [Paracoccaceae bacterium]
MSTAGRDSAPYSFEITSGGTFPDSTFLRSDQTRHAFVALLREDRMRARWEGISTRERQLHLAILEWFAGRGSAPSTEDLVGKLSVSADRVWRHLDSLNARDLIVLRDRAIDVAYPFTTRKTPHVVEANGVKNRAMCAIDALGIAAMLGTRTRIRSKCHLCCEEIDLSVAAEPEPVVDTQPDSALVWAGVQSIDGCAADTQCSQMVFFCMSDHLDRWVAEVSAQTAGFELTPLEAANVGSAIFKPFLPRSA